VLEGRSARPDLAGEYDRVARHDAPPVAVRPSEVEYIAWSQLGVAVAQSEPPAVGGLATAIAGYARPLEPKDVEM
jgi:hypothetical protein